MGTRARNLTGGAGDAVINIVLGAIQWWMYIGGEASTGDQVNAWNNPMAQWGWYNGKAPIVTGIQSAVNNVAVDLSLFGLAQASAPALIAGDGPGAALADTFGTDITFGTEHAASHFVGTGIDQVAVEEGIMGNLQSQFGSGIPTTVQGPFMGRISLGGQMIEYRGFGFSNGGINIGTYYPIGQ